MATKKQLYAVANDLCSLANQRFGLSQGMMMLMEQMPLSQAEKDNIVSLAKHRKFKELEKALLK